MVRLLWKTKGSHCGVAEDSSLLRCYTLSTGSMYWSFG